MGSTTQSARERLGLTLAIAIATGVHLLLLTALPQLPTPVRPEEEQEEEKTVSVILGSLHREAATTPSVPVSKAAMPTDSTREPPDSPTSEKAPSAPIPAVEAPSPDTSPENDRDHQRRLSEIASRPPDPPSRNNSQAVQQSAVKAPEAQSDQDKRHRQESTVPRNPELSPYELTIRRAIARELRYTASMAELESPRRLMLEIELMDNGILRRASVTETSGDDSLDYQARQAALVASPFPAVPEEQQERRFTVELRFTPASDARKNQAGES